MEIATIWYIWPVSLHRLEFKVGVTKVVRKRCSNRKWIMERDMYDLDKNRLPELLCRIISNLMLVKEKYQTITQPEHAAWWAIPASFILLAGLSGPLQALPENAQSEGIESSIKLDFSSVAPISLSKVNAPGRAEVGARKGSLEYDLDSETETDTSTAVSQSDDFPPAITLVWDSSRPLGRGSESVAIGPSRIMLATVTQPGVDRLARNSDAVHSESEDNLPTGEKPLVDEVVRSPFSTIALAVLALLGLVSVARRNDI